MPNKSVEQHQRDVKKIQETLKTLYLHKNLVSLKKSADSSNTTRNAVYKKQTSQLNLSHLNQVIELNLQENYVVVEPQITIKQLTLELLKYHKSLPVTPEFETITVGGAIMGAALESSSFKWGQFNDACIEIEFLSGDGNLYQLSPTYHSDLFYGLSGSYGSLGLITQVKLKMIDIQKYVKVSYFVFKTVNKALHFIEEKTKDLDIDYLDGIIFHENLAVVMCAARSNNVETPFYKPTYFSKWYYEHIQDVVSQKNDNDQPYIEWMELSYYLFRFDKGAFWMARYIQNPLLFIRLLTKFRLKTIEQRVKEEFNELPQNKNPSPLFHTLFNWALSSKNLYKFWHRVPEHISGTLFLVHDFYVPFLKAPAVYKSFSEKTNIFPIWLCPLKTTSTLQILSPHFVENENPSHFINMGFYGVPKSTQSTPDLSHDLEREILTYKGKKMLYSLTYYSTEEFRKIFNYDNYLKLRAKTKADGVFLSLEEKVLFMNK